MVSDSRVSGDPVVADPNMQNSMRASVEAITERLEHVEELLDELLDVARVQGLRPDSDEYERANWEEGGVYY